MTHPTLETELLKALKAIAEGLGNTRSTPREYMTRITKQQAYNLAAAAIAKAENH
jgi:hypothetical protein